jgi:hypothetical protein
MGRFPLYLVLRTMVLIFLNECSQEATLFGKDVWARQVSTDKWGNLSCD